MTLLFFILGLVVGWNFPQPQFAKDIQQKIMSRFSK